MYYKVLHGCNTKSGSILRILFHASRGMCFGRRVSNERNVQANIPAQNDFANSERGRAGNEYFYVMPQRSE
jgi:hypothetical protein